LDILDGTAALSRIIELNNNKVSIGGIAKKFNTSKPKIRRIMRKHGIIPAIKPRPKIVDWHYVAQHIIDDDIPFLKQINAIPTAKRHLYYRHIEIGLYKKSENNYQQLCSITAEQTRGCDSTYTKKTKYPRINEDVFIDETKKPVGLDEYDVDEEPVEPTAAEPPEDPVEAAKGAIQECKNKIMGYTGECTPGEDGSDPGIWYGQQKIKEIWTEHTNSQQVLHQAAKGWNKYDKQKSVTVIALGGLGSNSDIAKNARRLRTHNKKHPDQKIIIDYYGDFDSTGDFIASKLERILRYYGVRNFEINRVAITANQIRNQDLIEDPEYNQGKNLDSRFQQFKRNYPDLVAKYGEKFGVQLEAMITTETRWKVFCKLVQTSILDDWDGDVWLNNRSDEQYDYEANGEEEPEDIDVDNEPYEDTDMTIRKKMIDMASEAFKPGWEKDYNNDED
jgi:hypothetical protein